MVLRRLGKAKSPVDLRERVKMRPPALLGEIALFVAQSIRFGGVAGVKRVLLFLAHRLRLTLKVGVVGLGAQTLDQSCEGIEVHSRFAQHPRGQRVAGRPERDEEIPVVCRASTFSTNRLAQRV
jgi:hypothetical protein